ncbi:MULTISPECIES: hypothetical protein [Pseudomonadati]|jgi:uncharacterized protein YutE (UPF0331/DUF86 family)|uniref:DUF86 domain-containing protein n=1 Tax=Thermodesulfovibrio obliviosus TaxID=3118332 RepID=A0AAU8H167_9BACT
MDGLKRINRDEFINNKRNYLIAKHYLGRALEGILMIGNHFLSRLGAKTKDYQEIILNFG